MEPCYTELLPHASNRDLTAFCQEGWHIFQPGACYSQLLNSRSLLCCPNDALQKQMVPLRPSSQAIPLFSCLQPGGYWKQCCPWSPGCCYLPNSCLLHSGKGISAQARRKGRGMACAFLGWHHRRYLLPHVAQQVPLQLCTFLGSLPSCAVLKELQTHRQLGLCQGTP